MNILGISAFYHDSAACLVQDGKIVAAAQEERFTRKKHDFEFPSNACNFCLSFAGIEAKDLDYVVFYDKPVLKFERLLETYLTTAPKGFTSYAKAMPLWLKHKLWIPDTIKNALNYEGEILFTEHHQSHAGSAFYPSPFTDAAILTIDGVGEWTTNSLGIGKGNQFSLMKDIKFPHSLGLLYSAFTYYTGFKVNSGEYKVMGLAPYGEPKYVQTIYDNLIDLKEDGSFHLNLKYFDYMSGLRMTNDDFADLFGGPRRKPESPLSQREMDLARSIQEVVEETMLRQARYLHKESGLDSLCLAGGVALNCVGNGRVLREGPFKNIWIQPAAGDAGGALGAALCVWYGYLNNPRKMDGQRDAQSASLLGPEFSADEVVNHLTQLGAVFHRMDYDKLYGRVAELLAEEKIVGWFQGRMEFGPRALGNRSIIGDPRSASMQSKMNLKIKYRESFRPFAPAVMREHCSEYFELDHDSPYMLLVAPVKESRRVKMTADQEKLFGIAKLNVPRSDIPAVTHVDYSARVQTVRKEEHPGFYSLLNAFYQKTGCPVLVNTSFNVRGEPIVCTPSDAYTCFMRTEMDCLVVNNFLMFKEEQPKWQDKENWQEKFELD
ncbi:MAG: carbamoyltransferase [Deltaproteobacteria bacterium]|nr:carbamoyltransferase [Deltaproteobacteria bacterium]